MLHVQTSHSRAAKYLDLTAWVLLLASVIGIPFIFDSRLVNQFILPKEFAVGLVILVLAVLWSSKAILLRTITIYRTRFDLPIALFLVASLITSLFSISRNISFFGQTGFFSLHFISLLFGAGIFIALVNYCRTIKQWQQMVDAYIGIGGLMAALFLLKTLVHVDLLGYWLPNAWTTIDAANSLSALWLVSVFLMAAGQLIRKEVNSARVALYGAVTFLSFIALTVINYSQIWWMVLVGISLTLFVGFIFLRDARLPWLSALFALLLITGTFIGFGAPQIIARAVPAEISLSRASSWYLVKSSLSSNFKHSFIGNGLGTFGTVFSEFRDPKFNNDQYAWSLRFNQPNNTIDGVLAEGGLFLVVTFAFIILLVIGVIIALAHRARRAAHEQVVTQFFENSEEDGSRPFLLIIAGGVPWVVLTMGMFFFFYGVTLWFAWWLLLGLLAVGVGLCDRNFLRQKEYSIEDSPEYTLSFSFAAILILAGVVISGVWGVRMYAAEKKYAESLRATSLVDAEKKLLDAVSYQNSNENYRVALAQAYLLQAIETSKEERPNVEKVGLLTQKAVNEARIAAQLAPRSVAVWENLATMYENAAALIPEARDWSVKALAEARLLEPSNPVLFWRLGNNMMLAGKTEEAIKNYEQAIALKQDYVDAYKSIAMAYEQGNNLQKAIEVRTLLVNAIPSDNENLFNYGRLIYNRNDKGDRDLAEKIWLKVVEVQASYSNALYSLGSLYESRGQKTLALQYYNRVLDLNPTNKELKTKINALSK